MATTTDHEVVALEHAYWKAMQDDDSDAALELSYEPCIVTGPHGAAAVTHAEMSAMNEQKTYRLRDFRIDNMNVQSINDDVAIVGYTAKLDLTVDGKSFSREFAESSTWVRPNGHWLCAAHSEAPIGDPFGRAKKA